MKKPRVLVGLSGGVDSAVSAYLLQQEGYDVAAGFMKNYADESNPNCHTREDRNMAIKVAQHLGIDTFIIFDFRDEYNKQIIDYIYEGYTKGITPNPDVLCNNLIKFELFRQKAKNLGFNYIATGHYANIKKKTDGYHLHRGVDKTKDQSYFLSGLLQEQLADSLFPVGGLHKEEVRKIAYNIKLPNADRKDSQGLCFIGNIPIKDFLLEKLPKNPGPIIDEQGKQIGEHDGAYFFTIGQRHGLQLPFKAYVINTDIKTNTVIVGDKDATALSDNQLIAKQRHRIATPKKLPYTCIVKIRYRQDPPVEATLQPGKKSDEIRVVFDQPQWSIAPGQFVVAYDDEECLGNGVIC